jgi:hypothetical protein
MIIKIKKMITYTHLHEPLVHTQKWYKNNYPLLPKNCNNSYLINVNNIKLLLIIIYQLIIISYYNFIIYTSVINI